MADLFSPLKLGAYELPNRIVMGPAASGLARSDGFVGPDLAAHYLRRAAGGVGLIISEPMLAQAPPAEQAHLGLYDDAFVPELRRLVVGCQRAGARVLLSVELIGAQPLPDQAGLQACGEALIQASWRALCAGADGVMLSAADGGLLHLLVSPRYSRRGDSSGASLDGRLLLPLGIVEGIRRWLGRRLLIGFRLLAEEFVPGGLKLQDARVLARRLTAAGVGLLDVTVPRGEVQLARFPGWTVPLANAIKRISQGVPVIGSGLLGDPLLADSVIRDGSIDLVMLGAAIRDDPEWPRAARAALAANT